MVFFSYESLQTRQRTLNFPFNTETNIEWRYSSPLLGCVLGDQEAWPDALCQQTQQNVQRWKQEETFHCYGADW